MAANGNDMSPQLRTAECSEDARLPPSAVPISLGVAAASMLLGSLLQTSGPLVQQNATLLVPAPGREKQAGRSESAGYTEKCLKW